MNLRRLMSLGLVFVAGCGADGSTPASPNPDPEPELLVQGLTCTIPVSQVFDAGIGRDGIAALSDPTLVPVGDPTTAYLEGHDRVVGVSLDGASVAIPYNILLLHEIVNLTVGETRLAVTYCPLTGSTLVFDRAVVGGAELGVSGLLFNNNLIMYDRNTAESLWPQMMRVGVCGSRQGTELQMAHSLDMTWDGWSRLHPETLVVSSETGFGRSYARSRYEDYERVDNEATVFPMPGELDPRLPPKERVVGIPAGLDGGDAFPFAFLNGAPFRAVALSLGGRPAVLLWDGSAQGGAVYYANTGERELTFTAGGQTITDLQTGSKWGVDGAAFEGELAGQALEPYPEAYVAFWFAWSHFHPETVVREGG